MKCPDRQLLSVYFDGEMPSPWKEKMESHIAECPHCAKKLEEYKNIFSCFTDDDETEIKAARERVWQNLGIDAAAEKIPVRRVPAIPRIVRHAWQRRVSIPLPAAAAIAVALIALALLWMQRTPETQNMTLASETEFESPGIIPVSDMESVLQYLGGRDNGDVIILRLPESRNFVNYSEPAIIRAADYSRQMPGQQMPVRRKP